MIFSNTIEDWRISYLWKWYTYLSNSWILFCQSLLIDKQLVRFDNHAFKIVLSMKNYKPIRCAKPGVYFF